MCGGDNKYYRISKGYNKHCSTRCSTLDKKVQAKSKETCKLKYGVEHCSQTEEFQNTLKKTRLEKYGFEHILQSLEFKEKYKTTCKERYGNDYYLQTDEFKEKSKNTCKERYGEDFYSQTEERNEKVKETNLSLYGVEYTLQSEEFKEKAKNTCKERYGFDHYSKTEEFNDRVKNTCIERYGVEHTLQIHEFRDKGIKTNNERYGFDHHLQNPEMYEKHQSKGFNWKEYIFPSGKIVKVQGYEDLALDELLKVYNEYEIVVIRKDMPDIWYIGEDNKNHRYYQDFFIPKDNLIIEVKSTYTYTKDHNKNLLKEQACKDAGYYFQFMILPKRKSKKTTKKA